MASQPVSYLGAEHARIVKLCDPRHIGRRIRFLGLVHRKNSNQLGDTAMTPRFSITARIASFIAAIGFVTVVTLPVVSQAAQIIV